MHQQRSEDWLVVAGIATCVLNGEAFVLRPGEHFFVDRGVGHPIGNHEGQRLVVTEEQRGPYPGEDDIERLEDDHHRCPVT